ncbi:uncharacterized protein LOC110854361 [Folsomia candida]|uniref:uncharacterized protein LOC110854361 n=1 Tax=Folsomia candida TaxID=158441 RepID=UPI000B8FF282|nr:uncharacterized protein LOC110854361 [Folsomia candida]
MVAHHVFQNHIVSEDGYPLAPKLELNMAEPDYRYEFLYELGVERRALINQRLILSRAPQTREVTSWIKEITDKIGLLDQRIRQFRRELGITEERVPNLDTPT